MDFAKLVLIIVSLVLLVAVAAWVAGTGIAWMNSTGSGAQTVLAHPLTDGFGNEAAGSSAFSVATGLFAFFAPTGTGAVLVTVVLGAIAWVVVWRLFLAVKK